MEANPIQEDYWVQVAGSDTMTLEHVMKRLESIERGIVEWKRIEEENQKLLAEVLLSLRKTNVTTDALMLSLSRDMQMRLRNSCIRRGQPIGLMRDMSITASPFLIGTLCQRGEPATRPADH